MNKQKIAGYALAIALLASSCSKNNSKPGTNNPPSTGSDSTTLTVYGSALLRAESAANEMEWIASELVVHGSQYPSGSTFFSSADVNVQMVDEGKEILLSFNGLKNSTDGKKRSGKLLVEINNTSNNILVSADGYKVNDTTIGGTYFFERELNQQQKIDMNLTALNGKIGNEVSFSMERTQTLTAGSNTPDNEADDEFENANGSYYFTIANYGLAEATVQSAVKETYSFKTQKGFAPVAGRIKYTLPNAKTNVLNFGNGTATAKPYMEAAE